MAKVSIKDNIPKVLSDIKNLEKSLQKAVKESSRNAMIKKLSDLRGELNYLLNTSVRTPVDKKKLTGQSLTQKIAENQVLGSKKTNLTNTFETSSEENIYKAHLVNKDNNLAMRIRYADINGSYQDYVDNFRSILSDKVFAIQDERTRNYKYYIIPPNSVLEDKVLEGVKIFCSRYRDIDESIQGDDLVDIGFIKGQEKFQRDIEKRGYTEFTLKEEALKLKQEKGKDITDVITSTQYGEYQNARDLIEATKIQSTAAERIKEKTQEAVEGKNINEDQKELAKANEAIKNLKTTESHTKSISKYKTEGTFDKLIIDEETINAIKRAFKIWAKQSELPIVKDIEKAVIKAVKNFNKGR
jgi:hypothetical protein